MIKKTIQILWLDDVRNPIKYLFKKKNMGGKTLFRNLSYYKELGEKYNLNFIWVKSNEEFKKWIIKNGLPDMVSLDYDLGKGVEKGSESLKWLIEYCKEENLKLPKYYIHSANPNAQKKT